MTQALVLKTGELKIQEPDSLEVLKRAGFIYDFRTQSSFMTDAFLMANPELHKALKLAIERTLAQRSV